MMNKQYISALYLCLLAQYLTMSISLKAGLKLALCVGWVDQAKILYAAMYAFILDSFVRTQHFQTVAVTSKTNSSL